jgi:formylmethanofuran dehydrogenase subunit E
VSHEDERLAQLLSAASALHHHVCPRQVLGVRMGLMAGEQLGIALPQQDKRLLVIVETDGCFADGVSVATNCWLGRRTLRLEDYGKVAATFIDTRDDHALRIAVSPLARERAAEFAPGARNRWEAMLIGYQRMPADALLTGRRVVLRQPSKQLISRKSAKAVCAVCGEEIFNDRQVDADGATRCRACVGDAYCAAG